MTKKNPKMLKTDPMAHKKIMELVKKTELEQDELKLSTQEITRRIIKSRAFNQVEREILEDARLKKRLKGGGIF